MTDDATQQIAFAVLAYFDKNPDAKDTLKGIREWWLLEQSFKPNIALVKEALAELVDEGLILARKGKDGQTYYKVNRRRLKEIAMLLTEFESSDAPDD
jgi:hypothetical protein